MTGLSAPRVGEAPGAVAEGAPGVGKTSHYYFISFYYRFSDLQVQYFLEAVFLYHQPLLVASDFFYNKAILSMDKTG